MDQAQYQITHETTRGVCRAHDLDRLFFRSRRIAIWDYDHDVVLQSSAYWYPSSERKKEKDLKEEEEIER